MSNNGNPTYPHDPQGDDSERDGTHATASGRGGRPREAQPRPPQSNPPSAGQRRRDSVSSSSAYEAAARNALSSQAQRYPAGNPQTVQQYESDIRVAQRRAPEPFYRDDPEYDDRPRRQQSVERAITQGGRSQNTPRRQSSTHESEYVNNPEPRWPVESSGQPSTGYASQGSGPYPPSAPAMQYRYPPSASSTNAGRRMSISYSSDPSQGPPQGSQGGGQTSLPYRSRRQSSSYDRPVIESALPFRVLPQGGPGPASFPGNASLTTGTRSQVPQGCLPHTQPHGTNAWVAQSGSWADRDPPRRQPSPGSASSQRPPSIPLRISVEQGPPADPNAPPSPARTDREWSTLPERGSSNSSGRSDNGTIGPPSSSNRRRDQDREFTRQRDEDEKKRRKEQKRKASVSRDERHEKKSDRDRRKDRDRDKDSSGKSGRHEGSGRRDVHHRT